MTEIKILHVVNSLDPGGMENGIVNLSRFLDRSLFTTWVACLERRGAFAERLANPDNVLTMGKQSGFSWRAVQNLRDTISRVRPDCLHTHNLGPLIYGALATNFGWTIPILHGEHSELPLDERSGKRLWQRRLLYHACRKIHAVSETLRQKLIRLGLHAQKINVTLNGVDTNRFIPGDRLAAREKIGMAKDAIVIGLVGRFGAFKGHAVLFDSFEKLADLFPHLHLLFVGGGGPEAERILQKCARSRFARRIHPAGLQSDLNPYYQALDILVVPSTNEGLSNAILEAMSCGIPVLAHCACGNDEVITHGSNGMIADLRNADLLAEALGKLLENPRAWRAMGSQARNKVTNSFSIEKMVSRYEILYREVSQHS